MEIKKHQQRCKFKKKLKATSTGSSHRKKNDNQSEGKKRSTEKAAKTPLTLKSQSLQEQLVGQDHILTTRSITQFLAHSGCPKFVERISNRNVLVIISPVKELIEHGSLQWMKSFYQNFLDCLH